MRVPKKPKNGFKSVLALVIMDFFDARILAALGDGKPKVLTQILGKVDFSRNTLKLHLNRLVAQSLLVKYDQFLPISEHPMCATFLILTKGYLMLLFWVAKLGSSSWSINVRVPPIGVY